MRREGPEKAVEAERTGERQPVRRNGTGRSLVFRRRTAKRRCRSAARGTWISGCDGPGSGKDIAIGGALEWTAAIQTPRRPRPRQGYRP